MRTITAVFKLIRYPNLAIMVLSMYSVRHFIIIPVLRFAGSETQLSHLSFSMIVISVILIAAGGYILNDYYDQDIDIVNKPEKMIIGKSLGEGKAYVAGHTFGIAGIAVALFLGYAKGIPLIGIIHAACFLILWAYAVYFKRLLILGNILVSLLSAFILFISAYYDVAAWKAEPIRLLVAGYCVFAFLISLVRELIKDMEDLPGDMEAGCKTLPVVAGLRFTKWTAFILVLLIVGLLGYIQWLQYESKDFLSFSYIALMLQIPLFFLLYRIFIPASKANLHFCSIWSKLIMLTGILSMPVFYLGFT